MTDFKGGLIGSYFSLVIESILSFYLRNLAISVFGVLA